MEAFFQFAGDYWWLIFPVGAVVGGWMGRAAKYGERRRRDRFELERMRIQAGAQQLPQQPAAQPMPAEWELQRVVDEHDAVARRWLDAELDPATLIDFPLMTDMREPLTRAFHDAKRRADAQRPSNDDERGSLLGDAVRFARYRDAVHDFRGAFDAAEAEARRRRQGDFSEDERARLQTARRLLGLAVDDAASAAERQAAYRQARKALDGLLVLPSTTTADLERRVAGELEA